MVPSGIGYDAHSLVEDRPLVLAGVNVPFDRGLAGHSDGDVAAHAIIDAVLGAAGLGDLGTHFNSQDPSVPFGISSMVLMERAATMVRGLGWEVENVDTTIVAERPYLAKLIPAMRVSVANALGIFEKQVNIKATTTDGLGFVGSGDGIAAFAVVSLVLFSSDKYK